MENFTDYNDETKEKLENVWYIISLWENLIKWYEILYSSEWKFIFLKDNKFIKKENEIKINDIIIEEVIY